MRELHSPPSHRRPGRRWTPQRTVALIVAASGVAVLAACSSSSSGTAAGSATATPPNAGAFSGEPPSAVASAAESLLASASAAIASASEASAASVASKAAAASAFEASVSAQQVTTREKAASVLSGEPDGGNAVNDVAITGINRQNTGGLHAVVVTIRNRGLEAASYAVQVDFTDTSGKTVDSAVVGAENVPANGTAEPVAFSRQPADRTLLPVVVKAVRY